MTNEFTDGKYNEIYKERFPNSKCINGFLKSKDSLCKKLINLTMKKCKK